MSAFWKNFARQAGDTVFALLPTLPYAKAEPTGFQGDAVVAHGLAAGARTDGPAAFQGADFTIPRGSRTALIGPNGSGKSTLLRVLAGLVAPQAGEVLVAGAPPGLGRSRIAYLAQRPQLADGFPLLLRRLVQMGTYAHHGWFEECRHGEGAVDQALAQLGLTELADRPVHALSGGQLQRALIARAVVQGAEILLLDEPYAALDAASRDIIERFLFDQGHPFTVVMATHDPADLGRFERILELRGGAVITRRAERTDAPRHA